MQCLVLFSKTVSRLLKMSRRLTLGIGDNREHCFYIPVGYHMFRIYIDEGFELEELVHIRKRAHTMLNILIQVYIIGY